MPQPSDNSGSPDDRHDTGNRRKLDPVWLDRLHTAAFYLAAFGFALAAGAYDVPPLPFVAGLVLICALYLYTGFKYIEPELTQSFHPSLEALELTEREIIFTNWLGRRETLEWDRLRRVGVDRSQALFPDPWVGDYDEDYWFLVDRDDNSLCVPLELPGAEDLRRALQGRLEGFDADLADRAKASKDRGHWVCWEAPDHGASPGA
jgi:hypothetical protein